MINVLVVKPDGTYESRQVDQNDLETLQEIVEGYIEVINMDDGVTLVCNEEGLIHNLSYNGIASDIAMRPIVGTVFFCGPEFTNVPTEFVHAFQHFQEDSSI